MTLRKATAQDFYYIRRLPVQLARQSAFMLPPKKLRWLLHDTDMRLVVYEPKQIAAFLALRLIPCADSAWRFLEIAHFAADNKTTATEIAVKVTEIAREHGCAGVLVLNEQLEPDTAAFYAQAGFTARENTLMKQTQ